MSDVDKDALTGVCAICGLVAVKRKKRPDGSYQYSCRVKERQFPDTNTPAARARKLRWKKRNRTTRNTSCERCGFAAEAACQLDHHHRDGDHTNDSPENLVTLCANCHRLEHHEWRQAALLLPDAEPEQRAA